MNAENRKVYCVGAPHGTTGPTAASVFGPVCGGKEWPYETITYNQETIAIFPDQDINRLPGAPSTPILGSGKANAKEFLKAVNSHDALVEALEEALKIASDDLDEVFKGNIAARETAILNWKRQTMAALAKAKGGERENVVSKVKMSHCKLIEGHDGDCVYPIHPADREEKVVRLIEAVKGILVAHKISHVAWKDMRDAEQALADLGEEV